MPHQIGPHLEQRMVAFALASGVRPKRISAELAREKWGRAADLRARRLARAGQVG
jgi:hypothetical protein